MKVTIETLEKNFIRFQAQDDPHTLFNLLRVVVLDIDGVEMAGYARDRTFEDSVLFQIRTSGDVDPRDALVQASRKIIEMTTQFRDAFEDTYL